MHQSRLIEIAVGLFVAIGFAALFMLAMQVSNLNIYTDNEGYEIHAHFANVGGLKVHSPVSMAGVTIGRVSAIEFDNQTYEAVVTMRIQSQYNTLPLDTSASVLTAGLLGENYIGLQAGGDLEYLKDGDKLQLTQSALVLEQLVGQLLFTKAKGGSDQ